MVLIGSSRQRGFTLIEILFVLAMMGILFAITIPRIRVTPDRRVRLAAQQLSRDLEIARARAMSNKKSARVVFDAGNHRYTGYLDDDRDGNFALSAAESDALGARGTVTLPSTVRFGRGSASAIPGDSAGGDITLTGNLVEFSARGTTVPFGSGGTVYLVHPSHPSAVAAVRIMPSGSIRFWAYVQGAWQ